MKRFFVISLLLMQAALLFAETGGAQIKVSEKINPAHRKIVASKIDLLGRLIQESPAVVRIQNSDNDVAKNLLKQSVSAWQKASKELENNNVAAAEKNAKNGLIKMTYASSLVVNTERENDEQKNKYKELRERIESFAEAFRRISMEKQEQKVNNLLDIKKVYESMSQAEQMANADKYTEANALLVETADMVEIALAQARHKETLLHELNFETLEDEYSYEKQRNHSYMLLADLIKKKKKFEPKKLEQYQALLEENEVIREKAEDLAQRGDFESAIEMLEKGTQNLARNLRASGVVF